jgi:hypothetical protein
MITIPRFLSRRPKDVVCLLVLLLIGGRSAAFAVEPASVARVAEDIGYLASEELEGRGPGTAGRQKAAEYIRSEFSRLGLASGVPDGSYLQPFEIPLESTILAEQTRLVLQGPDGEQIPLERGRDFQPLAVGGSGQRQAEIVFAGYGISAPELNYDDYDGLDAEGKILLVIRRQPQQNDSASAFGGTRTTTHAHIRTKLERAKKQGAAAVLFVNDPFTTQQSGKDALVEPTAFGARELGIPFAHLTQATVERMLQDSPLTADQRRLTTLADVEAEIDRAFQPLSQAIAGWTADLEVAFQSVRAEVANVIGVLEGDGSRAEETIVLGAHYDHLGYGGYGSRRPGQRVIHPGADDNASGTAALLEIARRFAARPERPARRLVFVAFDAEERGLIGSRHYVDHPSVPLADTVAMLNFDMIGRLRKGELTVTGLQTAAEFAALLDLAGEQGELRIRRSDRVTGAGDHYSFYQRGIPVLHFFTGLTSEYHTPEDTFETINVDGVVQIIDLSERFLDVLLQSERPQLVQVETGRPAAGGMAYLGITPDYSSGAAGLRVVAVAPDSPAEKGGLQVGDIVLRFGETPVADLQGLASGLRRNRPGDIVSVTVQRDQETVVCSVTLGRPGS